METFIFFFSCAMAIFVTAGMINLVRLGTIVWPEAPLDDPNPPAIDRVTKPARFWTVIGLGMAIAVAFAIAAYFSGNAVFK